MKASLFDKLNLRPAERRLVIVVGIVVFIIVNWIWVWPRFFDWGKLQSRRNAANSLLQQYNKEIANTPGYQARLKDLESQGAVVASEDQALKLSTTVQNQAALSGVEYNRFEIMRATAFTQGGKTNQFFEEQGCIMSVTTLEKNLVDFLYSLGTGGSFIRVRSFTLNPDAPRNKLQGSVTLVASYAKKAPPKVLVTPAAAGARPTNAASRAASPFKTNAPPKTNNPTKK